MNTNNLYVVHLTKVFASGILKGLEHKSTLSFGMLSEARRHVAWCNSHTVKPVKPCVGESAYTIKDAYIVNR